MSARDKNIRKFFLGEWYPVFSFALVVFGYISGLEVYTVLINSIVMAIAIVSTLSIKPMLFFMLTFMYQFSAEHLPMKPYYSDHYYTGHRLYVLLASAVIIVVAVLVYLVKSRVLRFASFGKIPLFIPLALFCGAMVTNGFLVDGSDLMDLVWGLGQVLVYLVIYVLCFLGLRRENRRELLDYFNHLVILMSWVIILECLWFVISGDKSFAEVVENRSLALGVGNCNIVGVHAAMLIPANIYGFMKGKRQYLSIITALFVYAVALVSTSRNAMLFGTIYFVMCLVACFALTKKKSRMIKLTVLFTVFLLAFVLIFRDQVDSVIDLYRDRGMGNNGRYALWERAFYEFLESPIFGKGFYTIDLTTPNSFDKLSFDLVPDFAHNTIFELLGATGIVGFVTYLIYRASTLKLMLKKTSADRFMLMLSASYIVAASLLDNFILQIFSPVLYTVTVAIAAIVYEDDMRCEKRAKTVLPELKSF